jgi:hypothetical protein
MGEGDNRRKHEVLRRGCEFPADVRINPMNGGTTFPDIRSIIVGFENH